MGWILRWLIALCFWILAWLAPKPCQALESTPTGLQIARHYDQAYSPRLHIRGTWLHPDGIAQRLDRHLEDLHTCDVQTRFEGGYWIVTGLTDTTFQIKTNRDGMVTKVWTEARFDEALTPVIQCLLDELERISFPPSLGLRPTRITFVYHGAMQTIHDPLGTPSTP